MTRPPWALGESKRADAEIEPEEVSIDFTSRKAASDDGRERTGTACGPVESRNIGRKKIKSDVI